MVFLSLLGVNTWSEPSEEEEKTVEVEWIWNYKTYFFLHFSLNFSTYANYKTYFVLIFLGTLNYQVTALGFVCKILLGTSITLDGDGGFRYTLLFVISEKKSEENLCYRLDDCISFLCRRLQLASRG